MSTRRRTSISCLAAGVALTTYLAQAGSVTYNFDTDPIAAGAIEVKHSAADANDHVTQFPDWRPTGGNPASGGFLALTYSVTYMNSHIRFPDLDPGKVVTAFTFDCDLRVGNPSGTQGARAADGFSINFARSYDPVFTLWDTDPGRGYRGDSMGGVCDACENASLPETGTSTGIAISFDTWAGNTLPEGADLEGIIIAVDDVRVGTAALANRNGACDATDSMQTGPQMGDAYWAPGGTLGDVPTLAASPDAWTNLCWKHLSVVLDTNANLSVTWKGVKILDNFKTAYFPTPGRLLLGARTGGSDENTHFDNIAITTTAVVLDNQPPTVPGNLRTTVVGARRVAIEWDPSVDQPDPAGRVAYNVYRDGTLIKGAVTTTNYTDAPGPGANAWDQLVPGSAHTYSVKAIDLSQNESAAATLPVTLATEVPSPGYFTGQVFTNVTGTVVLDWWSADPNFPNTPGKPAWYLTGLSFGDNTAFGNTFGDNYGFRFAGTLTPPKTGQYRFFVRSDDASQFFLNTSATIPTPDFLPIAQEDDCCDPFFEPGQDENVDAGGVGTGTFPTSAAISLTAGTKYGFLWLMKEGGGGDWGQVAWRMEGDTTPAANLSPIDGAFVTPATGSAVADPGGASAAITTDLVDLSVGANSHLTGLWVGATTTSPWGYPAHYLWYKDGAPLMNRSATNLYIDVLSASDAGKYKVTVSVPGASVTSREMTLAVTNDLTPPTLVNGSAHGSADFLSVTFTFSEPVVAPSATTAGNYTISGGVTVSAAALVDPYTVKLTTSAQTSGTEYTITVNNVKDNGGNSIAANSALLFKSFVAPPQGYANYEEWQYSATPSLDTVINEKVGYKAAPTAPSTPDRQGLVQGFEMPTAWESGDNYGGRLMGIFIPPTTGDYVFFCTSDDNSSLFLSTDATAANKKLIAHESAWSNSRQWLTSGGNSDLTAKRSDTYAGSEWPGAAGAGATIHLTASQRYYIEGVWQEGGGGDGFGATYKLATEADTVVNNNSGASRIAGALLEGILPIDPWAGVPAITTHPVDNLTLDPGASATLHVVVGNGARPLSYQWTLNGRNIAGATSPDYTIANASSLDIGQYRCVVTNPTGSTTSGDGAPNPTVVLVKATGVFNIEAEDFDYNSGQSKPEASVMPYLGNAYTNLDAVYNVDYHNTDGLDSTTYRRGTSGLKSGQNANNSENQGGQWGLTRAGEFSLTYNFKIGWVGTGDWGNYTRTFPTPAKSYYVFAAQSYDGVGNGQLHGSLGIVTAGVGTTTQTVQNVGTFDAQGSGDWSRNNLVRMTTDSTGTTVKTVDLGGPVTIRWQYDSGDADYLLFIPTGTQAKPQFTKVELVPGTPPKIHLEWTGGGTPQITENIASGQWQDLPGTSPADISVDLTKKAVFARIKQ